MKGARLSPGVFAHGQMNQITILNDKTAAQQEIEGDLPHSQDRHDHVHVAILVADLLLLHVVHLPTI